MQRKLKTISEIRKRIAEGEKPEDIIKETLNAIKNSSLNNYIYKDESLASRSLEEATKYRNGKLFGVPIAIKDNININSFPTTCGSKILTDFISPYNAEVITKLKREGAVFIGKTNMDEFAMGSSTEYSAFGPAKNPFNPEYVPGGSSGGSASTVGAGDVPAALGSDTGGSIRLPAAFCGVYGLKPTYGSVSRYGLVAFASSLDQIGPIATNVEDIELIYNIISGSDEKDSTSIFPDIEKKNLNIKEIKIGIPNEYFQGIDERIHNRIEEVIKFFENLGAKIKKISLPHTKYSVPTYYIIAPAEASSNLARYDGVRYGIRIKGKDARETILLTRDEGFGEEVKRRIMIGTFVLSSGYYEAYYERALRVRTIIKEEIDNVLKEVDVILIPTAPELPFKLGAKTEDPVKMYLSDVMTVSANLAGNPALAVPCGFIREFPCGFQLIGRPFDEKTLFDITKFYEKERNGV